jgi:RNA polymerase sigma factor (sigma-70 family)
VSGCVLENLFRVGFSAIGADNLADMSDLECLQRYARDNSQEAFAAVVARHVDLVYSAALRQVRLPALAEEVAQLVFLDLARAAGKLPSSQPLAAWLYVVTRRTAVDVIRRESRRTARERTAAEILAMNSPPPGWSRIQDSIDDAMESLNETERTAIVLRFFENLSLREVGATLGISEDTAQKRVSRALDRLRVFFDRRGVAVTAAGLATDLSAHAIEAAPAGLSAAISAGTSLAAVAKTTGLIAMTTLQKSVLIATAVLAGGAGIYENRLIARQSGELRSVREQTDREAADLFALRRTNDAASARLKVVEQQIDSRLAVAAAVSPTDRALEAQMEEWFTQLDRMKELLARRPEWNTPELRFVNDRDWFDAACAGSLDTEEKLRRAISALRLKGTERLTFKLLPALQAYLKAHDGVLPATARDLAPYLDAATDRAVLDHYEVLQAGKVSDLPINQRARLLAPISPADVEFDGYRWIGTSGAGGWSSALSYEISEAQKEFAARNAGQRATSTAQLAPYLKWPVDPTVVQRRLDADVARGRP